MLEIKGNTLILDTESSNNLRRIIKNPDMTQAKRRRDFLNRILHNRNSYTKGNETYIPLENPNE